MTTNLIILDLPTMWFKWEKGECLDYNSKGDQKNSNEFRVLPLIAAKTWQLKITKANGSEETLKTSLSCSVSCKTENDIDIIQVSTRTSKIRKRCTFISTKATYDTELEGTDLKIYLLKYTDSYWRV